jgi:hypothetical protein
MLVCLQSASEAGSFPFITCSTEQFANSLSLMARFEGFFSSKQVDMIQGIYYNFFVILVLYIRGNANCTSFSSM